jgi:hypothetical protein
LVANFETKRQRRARIEAILSLYVTTAYRSAYGKIRSAYLSLRDTYTTCVTGSDAPLSVDETWRTEARAACEKYEADLRVHPALEQDFSVASDEVDAAVASWNILPMLTRLSIGDYLGFYQARDSVRLEALPQPVALDICTRVRDATGGAAITDTTLRKRLSAWADESCRVVE